MTLRQLVIGIALAFCFTAATAQERRLACELLKQIDLKPLLGPDHDAPVPFGKSGCRAESRAPGRIIGLSVQQGSSAELKNWLTATKRMNATARAGEVTVADQPALGPDAFSVREKGEQRQ